jgi:RHS repeat-associated protein
MDLAMSNWTSYNGLTNSIAYDSDLRPTSITVPGVESLAFSYDAANRITGITNGMDATNSETLGYDALNRLNSVTSSADNESYQYDADGNRTNQVINGTATSFGYASNSNQLLSTSGGMNATYGYDANGNTTTIDGLAAYQYSPFDRMDYSGAAGYVVSAEGQRIEKLAGTGPQYYAPGPDGTLLADHVNNWYDYVWLNGRVVTVISNGGVFPLHDDQTGRPLYMTDPSSHTIDWAAQGLPFDRNVTTNHWGDFNIGFPGQYWDLESDLWHNGNRDYDASLGRYVESDPIGLVAGVNTYTYADGNPISETDPNGNCPWCVGAVIGAVAGGIAGYETGGWKGAVIGGVVGGAVGAVAPWAAVSAGGVATEVTGSVLAGQVATVATVSAINSGGAVLGTVATNYAEDQPLSQDIGTAAVIGALAPLGEGAGIADGVTGTAGDFLSAFTGTNLIFLSAPPPKSTCP